MRRHRAYEWDATPLDPTTLTGLSGLELIRRIAAGELPPPGMAMTMGMVINLDELAPGFVVFEGETGAHVLNPMGIVHGGFAATLLDSAMGCAAHTLVPAHAFLGTVELKINYLRPLRADSGVIRAEGRVINAGRSLILTEGRLVGRDDGKLYAHGTCTCQVGER